MSELQCCVSWVTAVAIHNKKSLFFFVTMKLLNVNSVNFLFAF